MPRKTNKRKKVQAEKRAEVAAAEARKRGRFHPRSPAHQRTQAQLDAPSRGAEMAMLAGLMAREGLLD
jgi:hypothetical protein